MQQSCDAPFELASRAGLAPRTQESWPSRPVPAKP